MDAEPQPSDEDVEPVAVKLTDLYDMDGFHHDINARARLEPTEAFA